MPIELLKQNIEREIQIMEEIMGLQSKKWEIREQIASGMKVDNKSLELIDNSINQLISQIKIINNPLPDLVNGISFYNKIAASEKSLEKQIINVKYNDEYNKKQIKVAINKKEHNSFLETLSIHNALQKRLKKSKEGEKENEKSSNIEKFSGYIDISNKLFRTVANKLVLSGTFDQLRKDLIRITSPLIINSYISLMLFSTMITFFAGIILGIVFFIFNLGLTSVILTPVILAVTVLSLFYIYPSSKRKSLEKEINQELPFLIIYLAAIATSGIEPSKIFQIIVASNDYPVTRREIKKLTNYVNFYGYDLVSALKAVAKNCPSDRMAQLLDGLATTITSGGELTTFLSKHSDSLLFDYRLEREKYTHTAETFMNIYISVVIAAPMIMMIIFILMSLGTSMAGALGPGAIGLVTVLVISLLNIGFLVLLNLKQPKF